MTAALALSNDSRTTAGILLEPGGQLPRPRSALARNRAVRRPVANDWDMKLSGFTSSQTAEASFARTVVLVEGISDQVALEALAARRGRNLHAEGVSVVAMGGAQGIGRFLDLFGPQGIDVRLAGLCDAGEEGDFRRALERAGLGSHLTRTDMESLVSMCASQTWRTS